MPNQEKAALTNLEATLEALQKQTPITDFDNRVIEQLQSIIKQLKEMGVADGVES